MTDRQLPGLQTLSNQSLGQALQEQPLLQLTLYSFGAIMRRREPNGAILEYAVRPSDIAEALTDREMFTTGLMACDTLLAAKVETRTITVSFRPRQMTIIWLEGVEEPLKVPLPGLVMKREVRGSSVEYQVWAVAGCERPTAASQLYYPPLPNIFHNNGICWGSVRKTRNLAGHDMTGDWQQLLGSSFGSHTVSDRCQSHPDDVRRLLIELHNRKARVFPKRELVRVKTASLGQALGPGLLGEDEHDA